VVGITEREKRRKATKNDNTNDGGRKDYRDIEVKLALLVNEDTLETYDSESILSVKYVASLLLSLPRLTTLSELDRILDSAIKKEVNQSLKRSLNDRQKEPGVCVVCVCVE